MCSCIRVRPSVWASTGPRTVSTMLIAFLSLAGVRRESLRAPTRPGAPPRGGGTARRYRGRSSGRRNLAAGRDALSGGLLILSAFLASAVEMVEALTIVLAAGLSHGWRSALLGVGAAILALAAIVAALGPALAVIPLDALRLAVGGLLLVFGLQWLRKAILRASGFKALHDEDAIFAREVEDARTKNDWYGFTVAFKGVLLEGLEVAFIVVTVGTAQRSTILAAVGALAAFVVVASVGVVVHR